MSGGARVALVHGLWYGRPSLWPLQHQLQQLGHAARSFGYSTVYRSVGDNTARLADWARALEAETLHWVGHSMGGLMVLRMLAEASGQLPPGRVVLLGTPIHGSSAARESARFIPFRWTMGQAFSLLEQGYSQLPSERAVASIAGTASLGLGQFFGSFEGPDDGTVGVVETQADGLDQHLTLPVSHTGMLCSSRVAHAIDDFLRSPETESNSER